MKLLLIKCPIPPSGASWVAGVTGSGRARGFCSHGVVLNESVWFGFLRQSLTKKLKDWNDFTVPQLLSDRFGVSSIMSGSTRRFLAFSLLGR